MRRKTAREILAESLREIAEKSSIDRITIREITENCGYSPATFYRYFKDKYDLIAWDYVTSAGAIMGKIGVNGYEWRDALQDGATFFRDNRAYLKNLLLHTNGHEAFVRNMAKTNIDLLRDEIRKATDATELDRETELMIHVFCYGTVEVVCEQILGDAEICPEELASLFEKSLPASLKPYLYRQ